MYVTEQNAKTLMCCQNTVHKCLASDCMAWIWGEVPIVPPDPNAKGYCGVAGLPTEKAPKTQTLAAPETTAPPSAASSEPPPAAPAPPRY